MPNNLHCTAVVLADRGVLITGRSGAGKTTLALSLVAEARRHSRFARLVADDQLFVQVLGGRLVVEAPPSIRGLVETYGIGPVAIDWEARMVVDLVVRLVDPAAAPRYQDGATAPVAGVHLPSISLAERSTRSAVLAVAARLPF